MNNARPEKLDYRNIKQFKGEVIEDMSLWLEPFGIEIKTNKAVYQVYNSHGDKVAERTALEEVGI